MKCIHHQHILLPIRVHPRARNRLYCRPDGNQVEAINHKAIVKSLSFVARHWHRSVRVDDLARAAAMSRRGFHKAFTKHVGRTPARELRRLRLQAAVKLLAGSDFDGETIAKRCGFGKLNSFYVAFKQATGLSPMQYRRQVGRTLDGFPFVPVGRIVLGDSARTAHEPDLAVLGGAR